MTSKRELRGLKHTSEMVVFVIYMYFYVFFDICPGRGPAGKGGRGIG